MAIVIVGDKNWRRVRVGDGEMGYKGAHAGDAWTNQVEDNSSLLFSRLGGRLGESGVDTKMYRHQAPPLLFSSPPSSPAQPIFLTALHLITPTVIFLVPDLCLASVCPS